MCPTPPLEVVVLVFVPTAKEKSVTDVLPNPLTFSSSGWIFTKFSPLNLSSTSTSFANLSASS